MAHSGVIVAIYPERRQLARLARVAAQLPNSTPLDEMHVTICYLGEKDALETRKLLIMVALMQVASAPPMSRLLLAVRGLMRMDHSDDGRNALTARIVSDGLHALQSAVKMRLADVGVEADQTWPVYNPHLTLGYIDTYLPTPAVRVPMMTFPATRMLLCWGDERIPFPFADQSISPDQSQFAGYTMEDWHDTTKAVSGPMAQPAHGPGGLFSNPALEAGRWRKRRAERQATVATKPFVSTAQQRWAFATGQDFAKRWADQTDFSNLPRKVRRKSSSARRRMLAALGFKAEGGGYSARAGETIRGRLVRGADGKFSSDKSGATPAAVPGVTVPGRAFGVPKAPPKKKPKGGGKGKGSSAKPKAPKKTPEQQAAEREAKQAAEQAANLAKAAEALQNADAPIGKNGLDALSAFAAGGNLDADTAKQLADLGVVTLGADGTPRLNADGRKLVNAAKKGDIRGTVDAAFAAGEKMGIGAAGEKLPEKEASEDSAEATPKPAGSLSGAAGALGRGGDKKPVKDGLLAGLEGALGQDGKPLEPKKGGGGGGGGGDDKADPTKTAALRRRIANAGASQGPQGGAGGGAGKPTNLATPVADAARRASEGAQRTASRSAEREAQLSERRQRANEERAGRIADAVEQAGLPPESFVALRDLTEGRTPSGDSFGPVLELASLGLVNQSLETTDQGRRALRSLERGDVRGYLAAVQDAQAALAREQAKAAREAERAKRRTKSITLKHGKHDQSSHGRKGGRGKAARAAYQSARAGGASHGDAMKAANDVSQSVALRQRYANISKQLEGQLSEKQRSSLLAEQRRLNQEQGRLMERMSAGQRTEAMSAAVAPTVRGRSAPVKPNADGDTTKAYGADPNTSYTMQHRLVDMADVQASNLPSGAINPNYNPALQPRDRSRAASQAQIDSVARNLNADVLVTDFRRIDAGSPIIDRDGNVLSGNGRTLALQRAAELNPAQYAAYKQRIKDEAARLGIDPKAIDGMRNPVLVRELKGDTDPAAFAREANSSGTLRMSPLEQAMVDAQNVGDRSLLKLNVKDNQGIDLALRDPANKAFVNDFLSTVPANERANLLTRNGDLNQMGLYRAKAALYTKAFPGEAGNRLAESMLESLDPDVKSVQNGISASLPNISRASALIRSGDRDKNLDLSEDFAKTIDVYARIKDNPALTANTPANRLIDKYLGQSQMFDRELSPDQEVLLRHIDTISRKPTAVRDMFNRWSSLVENQPPPGQASMFGGGGMTKRELIDALIGGESGGTTQGGLFDG